MARKLIMYGGNNKSGAITGSQIARIEEALQADYMISPSEWLMKDQEPEEIIPDDLLIQATQQFESEQAGCSYNLLYASQQSKEIGEEAGCSTNLGSRPSAWFSANRCSYVSGIPAKTQAHANLLVSYCLARVGETLQDNATMQWNLKKVSMSYLRTIMNVEKYYFLEVWRVYGDL